MKINNDNLFVFQVHDIFHPFPQASDDEITFITVNESETGFCHLYKITSVLQKCSYNWAKGYKHSKGNIKKQQFHNSETVSNECIITICNHHSLVYN